MIKVRIGNDEREFNNSSEGWIKEQVDHRRRAGQSICIRIIINKGQLNMSLSTADCPKNNSRTRRPRPEEKRIFDFWRDQGLNQHNFNVENLIKFFRQIK